MGKSHQQTSKTDKFWRDRTSTPDWLFAAYDADYHFSIDLAASEISAKCPTFFTKEMDGLAQSWRDQALNLDPQNPSGWLNPPYSNILPWIRKAREEQRNGFTTVFLVMMDCSVEWWPGYHSCIIQEITGYYAPYTYKTGKRKGTTVQKWHSGRIDFIDAQTQQVMKDPLNKPCCAIIFPGYYQGPTLREPVSKKTLMDKGTAWLAAQAETSTI